MTTEQLEQVVATRGQGHYFFTQKPGGPVEQHCRHTYLFMEADGRKALAETLKDHEVVAPPEGEK